MKIILKDTQTKTLQSELGARIFDLYIEDLDVTVLISLRMTEF